MSNIQTQKQKKSTNKNVENSYTDPITGKFKKGNPGGGHPLGQRNFATDFDEVVEEIAKLNNITTSEARKILIKKAYTEAKDGNFPFYKDIFDRYYGKAEDKVNLQINKEISEVLNELENV